MVASITYVAVQAEKSQSALYVCEPLVAAFARAPLGLVCVFQAEKALCFYLKPFSGEQELMFVYRNRVYWWIYQSRGADSVLSAWECGDFREAAQVPSVFPSCTALFLAIRSDAPCPPLGSKSVCSHTPRLLWFRFGIFHRSLCSVVPLKPTPRFLSLLLFRDCKSGEIYLVYINSLAFD